MKDAKLRLPLILILALAHQSAGAGEMPYSHIGNLTEALDKAEKSTGVSFAMRSLHSDPKDQRPYSAFLEHPGGKHEIKVGKDGSFTLPSIPREHWDRSKVTHSLEPGALKLALFWQIEPALGRYWEDATLEDTFDRIRANVAKADDDVWKALAVVYPSFDNSKIVVTAIGFPRLAPKKGKAMLERNGRTVKTVVFSETGKVVWRFADHDPAKVRFRYSGVDFSDLPEIRLDVRWIRADESLPDAITVFERKVEQGGADEPATAPKSKPSAKKKSTEESKARPK